MGKRQKAAISLLTVGALFLVLATAFEGYPSTLCEFLGWTLTVAGLTAVLAVVIDWAAEYIPQWDSIESKWKRPIILGICLGASLLSVLAQYLLCGLPVDMNVLYRAVILASIVFTANQNWHGRKLEGSRNSRTLASEPPA